MFKIFIEGTVQGVGFRPYIFRKAKELKLVGSVKNTGNGVEIIVNDENFIEKLNDLPPLAKISNYSVKSISPKQKFTDFVILKSTYSRGETELPPDIFICKDCLKELRDQFNRRHDYYFITCTNCGPRFSMIEDYPYDRPLTSMKEFPMCSQCAEEYTNPLNRRYHAQTVACKNCGPKLKLLNNEKDISGKSDYETIKKAMGLIATGETLSIKGIGGFHICSLCDDEIVTKVRNLLNRPNKPFAIMVKDLAMLEDIAYYSHEEKLLLESPQRPIVILKKKNKHDFDKISELDSIGVMLPYTALHYLMFDHIQEPLTMTSCNIPGEPVSTTEIIGKYFLTHERKIVNRCDDSVLKVIHNNLFFLRRSRGYTPVPVSLPIFCKDTLAVGAELNNVICTVKKNKCYMSQYIGDTSKYKTFRFLKEAVNDFIRLTRLKPEIIACDLHPNYNSTGFAKDFSEKIGIKCIQIQHHKAHVASVAAEHKIKDYVGIAADGLGYGEDGNLWGGEVFYVKNNCDFTRIGHLQEQPQIGGDSATIYPKRMLFGILSTFLEEKKIINLDLYSNEELKIFYKMIENNFKTPLTTSSGRILDSVAALLKICDKRTYDGRPAMLLESISTKPLKLAPNIVSKGRKKVLLTTPLFEFLIKNRQKKVGNLAATSHMYLAQGLYEIAFQKAAIENLPIVFSGGVAYNSIISNFMIKNDVLVNKEIPCGDGGTCYGQAYLANIKNG
ncbi:MAG: carbamoyltransferase HypF [Candidatus Thermoplasmatota archaeon]|nr:carbamoyltransferase HypF [Candidatus Thermoplasmatota archaeon]